MIKSGMDHEAVAEYCRTLSGATEGHPFGPEALVFKVGGKIFAILVGQSVSLKCDPGLAVVLRENYPAVAAGYHLQQVALELDRTRRQCATR
jgi:predicted DNA-binding protein (MmcQ/YjbR family)